MKNSNKSCRICLKTKQDNFSIYQIYKQCYLPHIIYNISGVKVIERQEPSALICGLCAKACLVAHKIILRCQEGEEYLDYIKVLNEQSKSIQPTNSGDLDAQDMQDNGECGEFHIELLSAEEEQEMLNLELLDTEVSKLDNAMRTTSTCATSAAAGTTAQVLNKTARVQPIKRRRNSLTINKLITFDCKLCDFQTNVGRQMIEHNAKVHHINDTKIYACKYCSERFSWRPTLHRHIENEHHTRPEEKTYVCDKCGKAYLQETHLRCHIQEKHGPRLFKCVEPGCEQSFTRAFTLRRHFLTSHSNTAKYHCKECNKDFKIYDLWKYHNDVIHKQHKVYCPRCGYAFRNKEKLEEHLANDVCRNCTIPCNYCQRKFTSSSGLIGHMKNIHKF